MKHNELSSIRDTVQSIWVAIILAFVLRAFMLEAFEIPTGSMAPQLMGLHTLVTCPDCGYTFPRGLDPSPPQEATRNIAICPNCGLAINRAALPFPHLGGDRVLVFKLPRAMRDVQRWDVVVFKDVQENRENFIKRLVGLPGEVVRIVHGDVFVHPIPDRDGDGDRDGQDLDVDDPAALTDWKIARKPHDTQATMWQLLFDNDYQPADHSRFRLVPWQPLWAATAGAEEAWDLTVNHGRVFRYAGRTAREITFARRRPDIFQAVNSYNNPSGSDYPDIRRRRVTSALRVDPPRQVDPETLCSDLRLETMIVPSEAGAVRLATSHFNHEFAAEFSFDGRVRLLHRTLDDRGEAPAGWDQAEVWGEAVLAEAFRPGRPVTVALTHADWRATVWVDADPVLDTADAPYQPDIALMATAEADGTVPVPRVGITGLHGEFELRHTRVFRDVFYTSPDLALPEDVDDPTMKYFMDEAQEALSEHLGPPPWPGWGTYDNPIVLRRFDDHSDDDEFFMLGDNSPASMDSRRWTQAAPTLRLYDRQGDPQYRMGTVPRYQLIGKAFFVYWPAGNRLPLPGLDRLPLVPHVGKMRRIE